MTNEEIKQLEAEQIPTNQENERDALEVELSSLIADESTGLGDLARFSKNLTKQEKGKNKL